MSGYGVLVGASQMSTAKQPRRIRKVKKMKLTLKQRIRNWLNSDLDEPEVPQVSRDYDDRLSSDGMRLQIYKASGGYVVETRSYDRRKDQSFNTMHVITEDQDLGNALAKIVMMEALQR